MRACRCRNLPRRLRRNKAAARGQGLGRLSTLIVAVLAGSLVLSGCAPRGAITLAPEAAQVGSVQRLLVASSRQRDPAGTGYSREPGRGLSFSQVSVSVPPDREKGTVTFPNPAHPDPRTDFLTVEDTAIADRAGFIRAVNTAVARQPKSQREAFVFVHGFNTNFAEGLYRQAQMRHDFGDSGISIHYSWPSAANVRAYATDREATLEARDDLEQLIDALAQTNVSRIVLAGHSMGAFLVMEALRQKAIRNAPGGFAKVQSVVLMAPDIDVGVFRRQAQALAAQGVSIYVVTSSRDRALRLSAALRGTGGRLGSLTDLSQIAGLPVTVIDLTDVAGNGDALNHFKVATSPVMISLIQGLGAYGPEIFRDATHQAGLLEAGVGIVQGVTLVALQPLADR